jgi:hypothetical protein
MKEADDPIPVNAIRLTDAYERVLDAVDTHPEILPEFDEGLLELLAKSRDKERGIQDPDAFDKELEEFWYRKKEVNIFFRKQLEDKKLVACVRDPKTGETLQLSSNGWIPDRWTDEIPSGIWSDYVHPDDYEYLGPTGTFHLGALRPVFFRSVDFDLWFEKECISTIKAKKSRGRTIGSGSWVDADKRLLKRMNSLMKSNDAKSPWDAAGLVAAEAKGGGTELSKQSRLAKRYRKLFSNKI